MAWIESHQALERHPKTLDLMTSMGWDLSQTIGYLHRFWWWVVDYAEDGDLRKHGNHYAISLGLTGEVADKFVTEMKRIGFIDTQPNLRVHDWWAYHGYYLRSKYRHSKEKWERIRDLYPDDSDMDMSITADKTPPHTLKTSKTSNLIQTKDLCRPVIEYLNEKTGRHYDPERNSTISKVASRLKEGFTTQDCMLVIDEKVMQWGNSEKMRRFLRPETLFAPSHFEDYLQEAKERKGVGHGKTTANAGAGRSDTRTDRKTAIRATEKPVDMR